MDDYFIKNLGDPHLMPYNNVDLINIHDSLLTRTDNLGGHVTVTWYVNKIKIYCCTDRYTEFKLVQA